MNLKLRSQLLLAVVYLLILPRTIDAQQTTLCSTPTWNNTFQIIAGITGLSGTGLTVFNGPHDVYFTANNTMYVADYYNNRVQKFVGGSPTATTITNLSVAYPSNLYVSSSGALYVLDTNNYRVVQWVNNVVTVVAGGHGSGAGSNQIGTSYGMFVDSSFNIYVSENTNHRVTFWAAINPNTSQVVAGGNGAGSATFQLNGPFGINIDNNSVLYICDANNHRVQRWYSGAVVGTTVAGQSGVAGSWSYQLNFPTYLAMDQYGYLYIMDSNNARVQKWYPGASYGVTVISVSMSNPRGTRFDTYGNLVIADHSNHRVLSFGLICTPNVTTTAAPTTQPITPVCSTAVWNQTLTMIAGSPGNIGSSSTTLYYPHHIYIDVYGNLYVADCNNHRIQRFPRGSTFGDTVAGITSSNGGSYSQLYYPTALYVDPNNVMYIMDWQNCRVMKWRLGDPLGSVVAGGNGCGGAMTQLYYGYGLFVDSQNNVYVSEYYNHRVTKWLATNTTTGILMAGGNGAGSAATQLNYPWGVYIDSNQGTYVVDHSNHRVQYWTYGAVVGITVAGTSGSAGSWSYQFSNPTSITFDPYGYMYVLDTGNSRVQKWWPGAAYGKTVISTSMATAYGLQIDRSGNIVIAETYNHRVISFGMMCPPATTTTAAPPTIPTSQLCSTATWNSTLNLRAGLTGISGSTSPLLYSPYNIYFDVYGNLFVADTSNDRIQLFAPGVYLGTTVAGTGSGGSGYSELNNPSAIYVDANQTMYILDTSNYRVLKWKIGDPIGYIVVGTQSAGSGLNQISTSYCMFVDSQTNIYVSDSGNSRVVKWFPTNTTAGVLVAGGYGSGNTAQKLNNPWGVSVDANQGVYVVDRNNHRVQFWSNGALSGVTVAGSTSNSGPWSYQFNSPTGIVLDPFGYIYVLDSGNARIQKWWPGANYGSTLFSASFSTPLGMQLDRSNNLVVADTSNHRIVYFGLLCPNATTTTASPPTSTTAPVCSTAVWNQAFTTLAGSSGNRGSSSVLLYNPSDVAFDSYHNLYVVDTVNHRIQQFRSGSSVGTTVVGSGSSGSDYSELNSPFAIYMDDNRTMYILDTSNYRVLKWALGDPLGYVVAGNQASGTGLNQIGTSYAMFVDTQSNIYVSECGNNRVTLWSVTNRTNGVLVAAGNGAGSTADKLNCPWGVYVDVNASVYVVDKNNHRVQYWLNGAMAGSTVAGASGVSGPYAYQLSSPTGMTLDQFGYMYILDSGNSRVQRWYPAASFGVTVAAASMSTPYGIRIGPSGNIVVVDTFNYRVLSFSMSCPPTTTTTTAMPTIPITQVCATAVWNQSYSTLAGSMSNAGSTSSLVSSPSDITFDAYQNMYVVDTSNHRIQAFPPGSNIGTTVAGVSATSGSTLAQLSSPCAMQITSNSTMFILDTSNNRVLRWQLGDSFGTIVAGGNGAGSTFNCIGTSYSLFVDSQFNTYVSENSNHRVTQWRVTNTSIGLLVAGGNGAGNTADKLNSPWGIYVDVNGNIFVVDRSNHRVQRWDVGAAVGVTVAGSTSDAGSWAYQFSSPTGITFDQYGYMYVLDYGNDRVQKWYPGASYGSTVASTSLGNPRGLRFDRLSNIVIADTANHRIISFGLMCPPATTTTTAPPPQAVIPVCATAVWNQTFSNLAGATSTSGSTSTLLSYPLDISFDGYLNMYVADQNNHRIQRFSPGSNTGTTVAGFSPGSGSSRSELYYPSAISVTPNGTMFIADTYNFRLIKWQTGDPMGYVIAGGNGNGAAFTQMGYCYSIFVDSSNNVYISEQTNHRVTLWVNGNTTAGQLVAGGNGAGNTPDKLNSPWGVYVNTNRTLYVADRANHRIQRWNPGASTGTTVAGSTSNAGSWSYQLSSPTGITLDSSGYIYILDYGNSRIQKWFPGAAYGTTVVGATFYNPMGLKLDPLGNLVVADTYYHRVVGFGILCPASTTTTTAPPIPTTTALCATSTWNQTSSLLAGATSSAGSTSTLLNNPYYVAFDGYRNLYIADYSNHRIQKYQPGSFSGTTVAGFSLGSGSSLSELAYPVAIRVTANQTMYILDRNNYRVLQWQLGDPLGYVVAGGHGGGSLFTQIGTSYDLFVDSYYNIYISEYGNNRITLWVFGNTTAGRLVAGGNGAGSTADKFNGPWGIYVDSSNSIYVVDCSNHRVQRWSSGASMGTTIAGSTGNSGPWSYQFNSPTGIILDPSGYIYVLDNGNNRVQKWWPGAAYGTTVIPAILNNPYGFTLDPLGNMVIADTSNARVVEFGLLCPASTTRAPVPATQPIIPLCTTATWNQSFSIVAGATSSAGTTATLLYNPYDVAFDGYQNMYVADFTNNRIQKFPAGSYAGTTVAGFTLAAGSTFSQLYYPTAIAVTANSTMFIVDDYNFRVLKWYDGDPLGYVVAGGHGLGSALTQIGYSAGIFVDDNYNVYVSENSNHRVTLWFAWNNTAGILAAGGNGAGNTAITLNGPWGIYVVANTSLYIADRNNHRIQKWTVGGNTGVTVAGSTSDPGPWSYQLSSPTKITFDRFGYLYVLDQGNSRVQKWWPGATYGTTVIAATMSSPYGMSMDRLGNIFVVDSGYHRVLSFSLQCPPSTTTTTPPPTQARVPICATAQWNSSFTTLAGAISNPGSTSTLFSSPYDVTFDGYGNMYVADYGNHRIQQFPPGSNIGQTVAGISFTAGTGRSQLYYPTAIYVDASQSMYILDTNNYRVLKWQVGDPLGTVIAGGQGAGSLFTQITTSYGMFVDAQLNVYVSEYGNHRVTKWLHGNTTAGVLVAGGNGAGSTSNKLNYPWGIYVDSTNAIYVVDRSNHRVQKWLAGAATGATVAGSTSNPGSTSYQFNNPTAITLDPFGNIYVLDYSNSRVQQWAPGAPYGITVVTAVMNNPIGMQQDLLGNLVIADTSYHRILSFSIVCPSTTTTTTVQTIQPFIPLCSTATWNQTFGLRAGSTSTTGTTGTLLYNPYDMSFDQYQNMFVADTSNHRIQLFSSGSSNGITVAGTTGSAGSTYSQLYNPYAVNVDSNNTMYILDTTNYRVLRWTLGDPLGYVVAGGNGNGAAFTQIGVSYAQFLDSQSNIYVSEYSNNRVTKWTAGNTTASRLVVGGNGAGNTADKLNGPWGLYVDSVSTVFVVDRNNHRVQKWSLGANTGITVAGTTSSSGPWAYQFNNPIAVTFDIYGYLYVLDQGNNRVQKWWPGANYGITVVSATMSSPFSMKFDRLGNIFIADTSYQRILSFSLLCPATTTAAPPGPTQMPVPLCATAAWNPAFTQVAGGTSFAGSTQYLLSSPYDVAIDIYQNMYVVDTSNHRVQRFAYGSIVGTTVAGNSPTAGSGFSELNSPSAIYVNPNLLMYILDTSNYRVLTWQLGEPMGFVVAGGRGSGSLFTQIGTSYGLFVDSQYNVFVSENSNHRVTKWLYGNTTASVLVAGGNGAGSTLDKLNGPWGIYNDPSNSIYVVDRGNHRVQKWSPGSTAGTTVAGLTGNSGPWSYQLSSPTAITMDTRGYIYILDNGNSRVQKWWPGGTFGTTVLSVTLSNPIGMQLDNAGNLFVTDTGNHRILSFSVMCPTTTTTTAAPAAQTTTRLCSQAVWNANATLITGATSLAGSTATFVSSPYGVAFDAYQYMYVADTGNHRIQKYPFRSNIGSTVAGVTASAGSTYAQLSNPTVVYVDSTQIMYILDTGNYRVLKWRVGETLGAIVVNGRGSGTTLDKIGTSYGMAVDSQSNIYVSEYGNHRVTKWLAGNNTLGLLVAGTSAAGSGSNQLNFPWGVYVDTNNILYIADRSNHRIQQWVSGAAVGTTIAGQSGVSGTWSYQLNLPTAITFDQYGYMFIMDAGNLRIQRWFPGMNFGVTVLTATLGTPYGMNFDPSGNLLVADTSNHRIVSFDVSCPITTTATAPMPTLPPNSPCQTGVFNTSWLVAAGTSPTSGSASQYLNNPMDVYIDGSQNIFVADSSNNRIQKFPIAGTSIGPPVGTTVAGFTLAGGTGYSELSNPTAIFLDLTGAMYIADQSNYRIRKWLPNQPVGFTVAGGNGNGAAPSQIGVVYAIFVDNNGNIYVSENSNHRVALWYASNTTAGVTIAGTGAAGSALNQLNAPWGIQVDASRTLYISDRANHRIVQWSASASTGVLIAGATGTSGSSSTLLNLPTAIAVDLNSYLYVMDAGNNRVQQFAPGASAASTLLSMAFTNPRGMRLDSISNLYIADMSNHRIILFRCVYNASTTTITTTSSTSQSSTSTTSTSTTSTTTTTEPSTTSSTTTTATTPSTSPPTTIATIVFTTTTTATTTSVTTTTTTTATTTTTTATTTTTTATTTTATTTTTTTETTTSASTTTETTATTTTTTTATTTTTTTETTTTTTTETTTTTTTETTTTTTTDTTTTTSATTTTTETTTTTSTETTTTTSTESTTTTSTATTTTTTTGVGGGTTIGGGSGGSAGGQASNSGGGSSSQDSSSVGATTGGIIAGSAVAAIGLGVSAFLVAKAFLTTGTTSVQAAQTTATTFASGAKGAGAASNAASASQVANAPKGNGPVSQLEIDSVYYDVHRVT